MAYHIVEALSTLEKTACKTVRLEDDDSDCARRHNPSAAFRYSGCIPFNLPDNRSYVAQPSQIS